MCGDVGSLSDLAVVDAGSTISCSNLSKHPMILDRPHSTNDCFLLFTSTQSRICFNNLINYYILLLFYSTASIFTIDNIYQGRQPALKNHQPCALDISAIPYLRTKKNRGNLVTSLGLYRAIGNRYVQWLVVSSRR